MLKLNVWHTARAVVRHPLAEELLRLTAFVMITACWLLSVLVVSNRLGLLAAEEQQSFSTQIAMWEPIAPLFVHVACVLLVRPPLALLFPPEPEDRDAPA